jgi:hypothetical protein
VAANDERWQAVWRKSRLQTPARYLLQSYKDTEHLMMDLVMVALAVGFCALSIAYVYACDRL